MRSQDTESGDAAPSVVTVTVRIAMLIEPSFDVVSPVANVTTDADADRTTVLGSPAVHRREWNAEVLGQLDWAEETRGYPAIRRHS